MATIELRPGIEFETGCIFDGAFGRYNLVRLVDLAATVSTGEDVSGLQPDGSFVLDGSDRKALSLYMDGPDTVVTDGGMIAAEWVEDLASDAENYLQSLVPQIDRANKPYLPENVEGLGFRWDGGDFLFVAYDINGEIVDC